MLAHRQFQERMPHRIDRLLARRFLAQGRQKPFAQAALEGR
jgi:hypothetical protein